MGRPLRGFGGQEAFGAGSGDGFFSCGRVQLGEDGRNVVFDCSRRDEETVGYFGVGKPIVEKLEDFRLSGSKTTDMIPGLSPFAPGYRDSQVPHGFSKLGCNSSCSEGLEDIQRF